MEHELILRLGFFFSVLVILSVGEAAVARRRLAAPKAARWGANFALVVLGALTLKLLLPVTAVGLAALGRERGWGLLNNASWNTATKTILGLTAMDLSIYLQHAMFHALPLFWRFHRVHHADVDVDASTGLRFHPIEILVSMLIKLAVVVSIGPSPTTVLAFEILLNATSMFNHANLRLPVRFDRALRWVVVTPDMHRTHHSILIHETNSNFSFNFPWWDRLFGTYRAQPDNGHEGMTIGLPESRDRRCWSLPAMLSMPFIGEAAGSPFDARADERPVP